MLTDNQAEVMIVGARELRVIARGWQHPEDERGRHIPLLPSISYPRTPEAKRAYRLEFGHAARRAEYMPDATGRTEVAVYETTTEGTPISPAFPNTPQGRMQLIAWCADNATTYGSNRTGVEGWAALLFGDAAVALDGTIHASS